MVKALRGATSVNKNDHKSMEEAIYDLISTLVMKNNIDEQKIISIIFSQTRDLNIANPAAALRVSGKFSNVPLFCTQEPEYEKSINGIVRVLLTFETDTIQDLIPVYLGEASQLRKDIVIGE